MAKQLTEKQQKFLDVLFEEAKGDPVEAKRLAGYSDNVASTTVMGPLQDEIADKLRESLSTTGSLKAYRNLLSVLDGTDDPLGRKERITVARDLMDRAGYKSAEKVEVDTKNALFILPPKSNE